jgi:hypothetical protein
MSLNKTHSLAMDPTGKSSAKVQKSSAVPGELGGRMKKGAFQAP